MSKGIVKEGVLGVLKLRWESMFKSYRKRVTKTMAKDSLSHFPNNMVVEGK